MSYCEAGLDSLEQVFQQSLNQEYVEGKKLCQRKELPLSELLQIKPHGAMRENLIALFTFQEASKTIPCPFPYFSINENIGLVVLLLDCKMICKNHKSTSFTES